MSLTEKYPELASLIENKDGVLSIDIDSAEAQAVLDKYEDQTYLANSAALGAKIAASQAKDAVDRDNLSNKATLENEGLKIASDIISVSTMAAGATLLAGGGTAGIGAQIFATGAAMQAGTQALYDAEAKKTDALAEAMGKGLIV
jgi:hypothetical protein